MWVSQIRPQSSLIEPLPTSIRAHGLMGMMSVTKSTGDKLDRDNFEGTKLPTLLSNVVLRATKLRLLLQLFFFLLILLIYYPF